MTFIAGKPEALLLEVAVAPRARSVVLVYAVPLSDTPIGVVVALVEMARLPVNVPLPVGVKLTARL